MLDPFAKAACRLVLWLTIMCAPQIVYAQELSDKERSERITLKTYSDEEWEAAVRALQANRDACNGGDLQACVAAGDAYVAGDGVWPATMIAEILYKEACQAGLGAGCQAVGELGRTGYEVSAPIDTLAYFQKGCDLGDLVACNRFAEELRDYGGNPSDIARSDAVIESACEAGGMEACASLGRVLFEQGHPEDRLRAITILDNACRKSVLAACETLIFRLRSDPDPDATNVAQYEHFACDLGSFADCANMGDRVYKGEGIDQDRGLALVYYDKACQIDTDFCDIPETLRALPELKGACAEEDMPACARLGKALSQILSPEADFELALELLQSSCLKGIGDACPAAAELIRQYGSTEIWARLVTTDEMLKRGCELDNLVSCMTIARNLERAAQDTGDLVRAVELYARLCDAGFRDNGELTPCELESRHYGYVPAARPAVADERYVPPHEPGTPLGHLQGCMTHPVLFREITYNVENCPRVEQGIGSYRLMPGQAPWQALLWRPKQLGGRTLDDAYRVACGGSLIATGWILTAAHCLTDSGGTKVAAAGHRIRLGVFDPNGDEGISFPILRTIAHPNFDKANKYLFDIALIQYDHRAGQPGAKTNRITPITLDPLPVGVRKIEWGMPVYAYGWGFTELEGATTDYLQGMKMELSDEKSCTAQTKFRNGLLNAALCAGGRNREQACFGDSGGPLVYYGDGGGRPSLIGVVSAGQACGTEGQLSQYTRVAKAKTWIDSYVSGSR